MKKLLTSADLAAYLTNPTPELEKAVQELTTLAHCLFTNSGHLTSKWLSETDTKLLKSLIGDKFGTMICHELNGKETHFDLGENQFGPFGQLVIDGFDFGGNIPHELWNQMLQTLADATMTNPELWYAADCSYSPNPLKLSLEYRYSQYLMDRVFNPVFGLVKSGSIPVEKMSNWLRVVSSLVEYEVQSVKAKLKAVCIAIINEADQDQDEAK